MLSFLLNLLLFCLHGTGMSVQFIGLFKSLSMHTADLRLHDPISLQIRSMPQI